jgi:hypothetical protein
MKIDCVYIACCKRDYHFTKACVASIRYWNKHIPVYLIKDFSKGVFNTARLEEAFHVKIANLKFRSADAYCKLYPFFELNGERILLHDSDIVWAGNICAELEKYDEDVIVDGYAPADPELEMNQWYFNTEGLKRHYRNYAYPGFVFNTGQMVLNTSKFHARDFQNLIKWQENTAPDIPGVFLCEDQGILNYVIPKKMQQGEITLRKLHFFIWGWSREAAAITVQAIRNKQPQPYLIHWFGKKNGFFSFLPHSDVLRFYERCYYNRFKWGWAQMFAARFVRIVLNLRPFVYGLLKMFYNNLKPNL